MPSPRPPFRALLSVGLLLLCGPAEARFGKRSPPSEPSPRGDAAHDASPEGAKDEAPADSASESLPSSLPSSGAENLLEAVDDSASAGKNLFNLLIFITEVANRARVEPAVAPPPPVPSEALVADGPPPPPVPREGLKTEGPPAYTVAQEVRSPRALRVRAGGEGMVLREGEGSAMALRASVEGEWVGVDGTAMWMTLPADDGGPGTDSLRLFSAHLSLAVFKDDRTRLRAHAGVAGVAASDFARVGPSFAVSFERCLVGALDVEARGQVVPIDYLQVDAQAGLAAHMGPLMLRGGWRWLMLDDRGLVDGVAHRDVVSAPYAGAELYF